ncbi:MAG: aldehyde dehydrogenase family protein, partial [Desulfobacterales bacterium]|nr:aldehyde dehydrogenase family protein [Desulfobacterales bacterium]
MEFTRVKNFIDGEFVEETGVEYLTIYNPSTGEQIGELPLSSTETAQKAIDSSYEAYLSWKNLPIAERVSYLFNLRQKMIDKREDLAVAIATDQAKHISEARGKVQRVIELLETACS